MKKIISFLVLAVLLVAILPVDTKAALKFKDVPSTYWASSQIEYLAAKGIITGYSHGRFGPQDEITWAQVAIMLVRALKLPTANEHNLNFTGVPTNHYAYQDIAALVEKDILPISSTFDPDQTITRAEMASLFTKVFNLKGTYMGKIYDVSKSTELYRAVSAMADQKITTIDEKGQYVPNGKLTRVQFSVFLARAINPNFRQMVIQQDFLENAAKGTLGTCSIVYNRSKTILYIKSQLGEPVYEGGFQDYYLNYGGCFYGFSSDYSTKDDMYKNSPLLFIDYIPNDKDLTLAKAAQIIGQPRSIEYDEFLPGLTYYYQAGPYVVYFNANDASSPVRYIEMYKPNH